MRQFTTLSLIYSHDLKRFYRKLSHLPGFVLLESTDQTRGRYDILSAYPYDQIRIDAHTNNIEDELSKCGEILSVESSSLDLPFQGGVIGYVSYDLGSLINNIHSPSQPTLKSMPLLDFGLYDWALITDHHLKKVTLFAANRHPSSVAIIDEIINLWEMPAVNNDKFRLKNEFTPLISKDAYEHSFKAIRRALLDGRSYQVNLTQPYHAPYEGNAWDMYQSVSARNPVPFSAFMRTNDADVLSFSPERFILYEHGRLLTSPIKGTIGRSNDMYKDNQFKNELASCPKNRAENVMIVDLLRNDFGAIAKPHSVRVTNLCSIQSYSSVHHLVSDIEAESIPNINPFEVFMRCFPGGSITGAPKLESMKIISEQEPYARGIYCGSIGYFSHHGRFDTNIAIRTITAKDGILHLAAGGGIVIDSNCEDEYQECTTKITAIINGLKP